MKLDPRNILIVRHGSTGLNSGPGSTERFRGHRDVPLNPKGREEASETARALSDSGLVRIVSSDLSRAYDTAVAIGKAANIKVEKDRRLRPWDLGDLTGTDVKDGISTIKSFAVKHPDTPIPGGESFNTFKDRALDAFSDIIRSNRDNGPTAIVTHTRNTQLLKGWLDNGRLDPAVNISAFNDYSKETMPGRAVAVVPNGKRYTIKDIKL